MTHIAFKIWATGLLLSTVWILAWVVISRYKVDQKLSNDFADTCAGAGFVTLVLILVAGALGVIWMAA